MDLHRNSRKAASVPRSSRKVASALRLSSLKVEGSVRRKVVALVVLHLSSRLSSRKVVASVVRLSREDSLLPLSSRRTASVPRNSRKAASVPRNSPEVLLLDLG